MFLHILSALSECLIIVLFTPLNLCLCSEKAAGNIVQDFKAEVMEN